MNLPMPVHAAHDSNPVFAVRELSKRFAHIQVLRGVSMDFRGGEVHAIVGENGAGKSTLMHLLTGVYAPDGGEILFEGKSIGAWKNEQEAIAHGIGIVYQERSLFASLSVVENIFAARPKTRALGTIDFSAMRYAAREILLEVGLDISLDHLVGDLSPAQQQQVEIAKAISSRAKILILDEPTACLSNAEVSHLFACIRRLQARGVTILYVSHRLEEIFEIADRVSVLKDGVLQRTMSTSETNPTELISLMVGRSWNASVRRTYRRNATERARLSVRGLSDATSNPLLQDISFDVFPGEIVSLAGLVGSGRTEVAASLFGDRKPISATIQLDGEEYRPSSPKVAIDRGIALVTEDRRESGMFHDASITENMISAHGKDFGGWRLQYDRLRSASTALADALGVVRRDMHQPIMELSGGNQQKVLLARWLFELPKKPVRLLILDEPTRGVDVNAKDEIHKLIKRLADEQWSVLLISSDLLEVLSLADTIFVLRQGRCVGSLNGSEATEASILQLASIAT